MELRSLWFEAFSVFYLGYLGCLFCLKAWDGGRLMVVRSV